MKGFLTQYFCTFSLCGRHVYLRPLPRPRRLLLGGVQPLWPSGEASGLWEALRAETRSSGQALRKAPLSHAGPPAPETLPRPLPVTRDQRPFCFVVGGAGAERRAAQGRPALTFHPAPVQILQELQGWSPVRDGSRVHDSELLAGEHSITCSHALSLASYF